MDNPKPRRSKTGCTTCRSRKVRCDEQHPVCRACTRLHLRCQYAAPGKCVDVARKNSRQRQTKFRVRFVEGATSRHPRTTTEPDSPSSRPMSPSPSLSPSPSPRDSPTASPEDRDVPPLRRTGARTEDAGALSRLPLSPLWSGEGIQNMPEDGPMAAGLDPNFHLGNGEMGHMNAPHDIETMLDSITFDADMGVLWDSMPVFDNSELALGSGYALGAVTAGTTTDVSPAPSKPPPQSPALSRFGDSGPPVTIRPEDREPLQHYLSTMVQFAKLRSSASDNIYCYIFTNMGLTHLPLYEAILAWAALHLAQVRSSPLTDAETRYQRASSLLYEDVRAADHVDLTLVTVWILLQYELFYARGIDRFIRLLNYVADVVEGVFKHHGVDSVKEQLGPVGLRVLMWLSAFDRRAALFGSPCRLLRCLKMHSSVYNTIDSRGSRPTDQATAPIEFDTTESKACLRLAIRLNILGGSCTLLGRWQGDNREQESAWISLRESLETVRREVESHAPAPRLAMRISDGDMDVPTMVNTLEYNWIQIFSMYYSTVILYQQHCPTAIAKGQEQEMGLSPLPSTTDSSSRIIRLSRHIMLCRPNSPQAIWPQTLFQAGVETDDPIYQSWVLGAFAQAERWGLNVRKTRLLLERIIKYPRELKARLDIPSLMGDLGGVFVV